MTRILFVVNMHPNEAFAISVANQTARQLQKKRLQTIKIPEKPTGDEVILAKVKPEDTLLGRIPRVVPKARRRRQIRKRPLTRKKPKRKRKI